MNFKEYIVNDVNEKKVLIDLLPKNTSKRKEKYKDTALEIKEKYLKSKEDVKKFIDYKYEKLLPKKTIKSIELELREIEKLNELLVLGNPLSTFYEKMEFDLLLYDLMHYYDNSLENVNKVIVKFINKIQEAGVDITPNDIKINVHSYLYLSNIFNNYILKIKKVSTDEFEKIFWKCPKVIEYVIINLRIIVRKNEKKFNNYIRSKLSAKLKINNFTSYDEVVDKIKLLKEEIREKTSEDEYDIVNLCLDDKLDINSFAQTKENDYSFFMLKPIDLNDKISTKKFFDSIITLKYGLEEYLLFLEYKKVLDDIKTKYTKYVSTNEKQPKLVEVKNKKNEILKLEKQILKMRVNRYTNTIKELENNLKPREIDKIFKQELLLDDLYKLYNELNEVYFDEKIKETIKINTYVSDIFEIFNAYPYFNKRMIKKVFEVDTEEEIENIRTKIKDFVYNPHRKIIDMIPVFVEKNVPQLLANGYRFENLNITEESFEDDNINNIFDKCNRIIRSTKIDKFKLSLDEINFLVEVTTLKNKDLI